MEFVKNLLKNYTWIVPSFIAFLALILNFVQFKKSRKDKKGESIKGLNDKIESLEKELEAYRDIERIEKRMRRDQKGFFIFKDDPNNIPYCPVCWGKDNKLVQLSIDKGLFKCFVCGNDGVHNQEKADDYNYFPIS